MTSWADELFAFSKQNIDDGKSGAVMENFDTGANPDVAPEIINQNEEASQPSSDGNVGILVTDKVDIPEFYNTGSIPGLSGDVEIIAQNNISIMTLKNLRTQVGDYNSEHGGIDVKVFDIVANTLPELNDAESPIKRNMFSTLPSSAMVIELDNFLADKLNQAADKNGESAGERYMKLQEIIKDFKSNFKFKRLGARISILENMSRDLRHYLFDDVRFLNQVFEKVLESHPRLKEYKTNVINGQMPSMYYFGNQNGLNDMGSLIRLINFRDADWFNYRKSEYHLRMVSIAGKLDMPAEEGVSLTFFNLLDIITGKGNATDHVPLFSAVNNMYDHIIKGTSGQEPLLVMKDIEAHIDEMMTTHDMPVSARTFSKKLFCYVEALYVLVRFLTCLDYIVAGMVSFIHVVGESQSEAITAQLNDIPDKASEVLDVFKKYHKQIEATIV